VAIILKQLGATTMLTQVGQEQLEHIRTQNAQGVALTLPDSDHSLSKLMSTVE
jgi:hypothetical protein